MHVRNLYTNDQVTFKNSKTVLWRNLGVWNTNLQVYNLEFLGNISQMFFVRGFSNVYFYEHYSTAVSKMDC